MHFVKVMAEKEHTIAVSRLEYEPTSSQRIMPLPSHLNTHFFSEVLGIMSLLDKVPFIFWQSYC